MDYESLTKTLSRQNRYYRERLGKALDDLTQERQLYHDRRGDYLKMMRDLAEKNKTLRHRLRKLLKALRWHLQEPGNPKAGEALREAMAGFTPKVKELEGGG